MSVTKLALNESEITPEMLAAYPIWMDAHAFDDDDLVARYGRTGTECARVAYEGSYPYPFPVPDHDTSRTAYIVVRCQFQFANGHSGVGTIVPTLVDMRSGQIVLTHPHFCVPHSDRSLVLQIGSLSHQPDEMRRKVLDGAIQRFETHVGKLKDIFPVEITIDEGLLSPNVPRSLTIPALTYRMGKEVVSVL